MFLFGKKKKEKKQEQAVPVVNKEELIAKASEKVTELESKTGDERVSLLHEIGSLYTHKQKKQIWQSNIMKKAWNFASSTEKRAQI